jgi:tetratricopeptide (TPR) repeat protein
MEIDPKDAVIYYNRGITYGKIKDYSKALADYNQAIQIDPNYTHAYNNRGNVYYNLKDYSKTLADYSKSMQINPYNDIVY